jgi:uncharacterized lipoprotein NlpE involved in copper resistance
MKKTLFAFALVGSVLFVSCNNAEENAGEGTEQNADEGKEAPSIVGTWQMSDMDMGIEIPAEELEMYEQTVKETSENTKYTFNADGTFKVNTMMLSRPVDYAGTYTAEGETLSMTEEGAEPVEFGFKVTDTELIVTQEDRGATITMTFERN